MNNNKLEIYLQTYNEEKNILNLIYECIDVCEKYNLDYRLIVKDNASTDATVLSVRNEFQNNSNIDIIQSKENFGYSKSVYGSIKNCKSNFCIILDGDGQFSPIYIPEIVSKLNQGVDLVLGERVFKAGGFWRKLGSRVFLLMCKKVINYDGPDINAGIRGLSRRGLNAIVEIQNGRLANPSIWFQCKKSNLIIEYVKIEPRDRKYGTSSLPWLQPFSLAVDSYFELKQIINASKIRKLDK